MKTISLTQDKVAIVDDEDYEMVSHFRWGLHKDNRNIYARCRMNMGKLGGKYRRCSMFLHQLVMRPPIDMQVDHKDHDGLNCTKNNMRLCTHQQNNQNCHPYRNLSHFKGVFEIREKRCWRVIIGLNGKNIHLGYFDSEIEAARAYDRAALKYFGEFACTNFPKEEYVS